MTHSLARTTAYQEKKKNTSGPNGLSEDARHRFSGSSLSNDDSCPQLCDRRWLLKKLRFSSQQLHGELLFSQAWRVCWGMSPILAAQHLLMQQSKYVLIRYLTRDQSGSFFLTRLITRSRHETNIYALVATHSTNNYKLTFLLLICVTHMRPAPDCRCANYGAKTLHTKFRCRSPGHNRGSFSCRTPFSVRYGFECDSFPVGLCVRWSATVYLRRDDIENGVSRDVWVCLLHCLARISQLRYACLGIEIYVLPDRTLLVIINCICAYCAIPDSRSAYDAP